MKATGSIRTATRWSSSSALAAALLVGAACVTQATVQSSAAGGVARIGIDDARTQLDALLGAECPRLVKAGKLTGEAWLGLAVDRTGAVQTATVSRSSGDRAVDERFSSVAALLKFDPPAAMTRDVEETRFKMGYSCSETVATVTIDPL